MKFNLPKITYKIINRYIYFLLIIFIIIVSNYLFLFLYKNLYQIIAHSNEIVILKEKVSAETVNINEFNKIINNLDKKRAQPKTVNNLNDPFN